MKLKLLEKARNAGAEPGLALLEEAIVLDFPREGEVIESAEYTFRVGAPEGAEAVEIRIDEGPWQSCRPAAGYWWFDWFGFEPGPHRAQARAKAKEKTGNSRTRAFHVKRKGK